MTPEEFAASLEPAMREIDAAARQAERGARIRDSGLDPELTAEERTVKAVALGAVNDQLDAAIKQIKAQTEKIEAQLRDGA